MNLEQLRQPPSIMYAVHRQLNINMVIVKVASREPGVLFWTRLSYGQKILTGPRSTG